MLQPSPKLNEDLLHEIIHRKEKTLGYKLHTEDFDFLTNCILNFIDRFTTKYIEGAREHEDESAASFPESGLNFVNESHNEVLDLWAYLQAEQHKQRKEQQKCKQNQNQ